MHVIKRQYEHVAWVEKDDAGSSAAKILDDSSLISNQADLQDIRSSRNRPWIYDGYLNYIIYIYNYIYIYYRIIIYISYLYLYLYLYSYLYSYLYLYLYLYSYVHSSYIAASHCAYICIQRILNTNYTFCFIWFLAISKANSLDWFQRWHWFARSLMVNVVRANLHNRLSFKAKATWWIDPVHDSRTKLQLYTLSDFNVLAWLRTFSAKSWASEPCPDLGCCLPKIDAEIGLKIVSIFVGKLVLEISTISAPLPNNHGVKPGRWMAYL